VIEVTDLQPDTLEWIARELQPTSPVRGKEFTVKAEGLSIRFACLGDFPGSYNTEESIVPYDSLEQCAEYARQLSNPLQRWHYLQLGSMSMLKEKGIDWKSILGDRPLEFVLFDKSTLTKYPGCEQENLPPWWEGRNIGDVFFFTYGWINDYQSHQERFNPGKGPYERLIAAGGAHEILHILHRTRVGPDVMYALFLEEGPNIIVGDDLADLPSDDLGIYPEYILDPLQCNNVTKLDKRRFRQNIVYQWSAHFFDHLVKEVSIRNNVTYKQAFGDIFMHMADEKYIMHIGEHRIFDHELFFKDMYGVEVDLEFAKLHPPYGG